MGQRHSCRCLDCRFELQVVDPCNDWQIALCITYTSALHKTFTATVPAAGYRNLMNAALAE